MPFAPTRTVFTWNFIIPCQFDSAKTLKDLFGKQNKWCKKAYRDNCHLDCFFFFTFGLSFFIRLYRKRHCFDYPRTHVMAVLLVGLERTYTGMMAIAVLLRTSPATSLGHSSVLAIVFNAGILSVLSGLTPISTVSFSQLGVWRTVGCLPVQFVILEGFCSGQSLVTYLFDKHPKQSLFVERNLICS